MNYASRITFYCYIHLKCKFTFWKGELAPYTLPTSSSGFWCKYIHECWAVSGHTVGLEVWGFEISKFFPSGALSDGSELCSILALINPNCSDPSRKYCTEKSGNFKYLDKYTNSWPLTAQHPWTWSWVQQKLRRGVYSVSSPFHCFMGCPPPSNMKHWHFKRLCWQAFVEIGTASCPIQVNENTKPPWSRLMQPISRSNSSINELWISPEVTQTDVKRKLNATERKLNLSIDTSPKSTDKALKTPIDIWRSSPNSIDFNWNDGKCSCY